MSYNNLLLLTAPVSTSNYLLSLSRYSHQLPNILNSPPPRPNLSVPGSSRSSSFRVPVLLPLVFSSPRNHVTVVASFVLKCNSSPVLCGSTHRHRVCGGSVAEASSDNTDAKYLLRLRLCKIYFFQR